MCLTEKVNWFNGLVDSSQTVVSGFYFQKKLKPVAHCTILQSETNHKRFILPLAKSSVFA